jgi:hypothetical protein
MKNEQNRNQSLEEGRIEQFKNKINTQNSFYKDVFSFKKRFDLNKFEKLDDEDKSVIEEKLKQIKELQEQITNFLI